MAEAVVALHYRWIVIELRTPRELDEMKPAGRLVASVLTALREAADVGVNLLELDALAHRMIKDAGAESCYIDYHPSFGASPFGKVLCTSVNEAVLHGLPHDYTLADGDLLRVWASQDHRTVRARRRDAATGATAAPPGW